MTDPYPDPWRGTPFEGAEVIHVYTRAQAIADGTLVAVDEGIAREAGFVVPVAITRTVWEDCVAWSNDDEIAYQDESGRLWDVLFMAHMAIRRAKQGAAADRLTYTIARIPRGERVATDTELILHIGPGDAGEPVITVMYPIDD